MLRRESRPWITTAGPVLGLVLGLLVVSSGQAGPIGPHSTGDVEIDFPAGDPDITVLVNPRYPTVNPEQYIAENNLSVGWSIKDIRLFYDEAADELHVGLNFFGIAGDADGNGDPGTVSPEAAAMGFIDVPHLGYTGDPATGGRESITVGFDMTGDGRPDFLAGVPGDKYQAGPGINGFSFAPYTETGLGLANSYGEPMLEHLGGLRFDPSAEHPDFEFLVTNFSKLPGYNAENGFGLMAFAGSPDDLVEEEGVFFPRISPGEIPPGNEIPEPASLLAWAALIAGGAAWGHRRRGRRNPRN